MRKRTSAVQCDAHGGERKGKGRCLGQVWKVRRSPGARTLSDVIECPGQAQGGGVMGEQVRGPPHAGKPGG